MFKNKKIIVAFCALLMAFGISGCVTEQKPDESPDSTPIETPDPSVSISKESLELGLFEECTITASLTELEGAVTWTSSAPSIATVENGVVKAVGIGTATITATIGEYSDTCIVTVARGEKTPVFTNLEEEFSVVFGATPSLDIAMELDGKVFTDASFSFSTTGDVLSISETGVITTNKLGTQNVTVTVKYGEITLLTQEVAVTVYEIGAVVTGLQSNVIVLKSESALAGENAKFDLSSFKAQLNGADIQKTLTYTIEDDSIVVVENGKLVGKKAGATKVTVSFTSDSGITYDSIVNVTVDNCVQAMEWNAEYVKLDGTTATFALSSFQTALANVSGAKLNGESVEVEVNSTNLILKNAFAGEVELTVSADNVDYTVDVIIADCVIESGEQFETYWKAYDSYKYAVLANDVVCTGTNASSNAKKFYQFNGLGHTVSNLYIRWSMFTAENAFTTGSVLKNVNFVNYKTDKYGIFGGRMGGGLIENVKVSAVFPNFDLNDNWYGYLFDAVVGAITLKNVEAIIDVPETMATKVVKLYKCNSGSATLENVKVVTNGQIANVGENDFKGQGLAKADANSWTNVNIVSFRNAKTVEIDNGKWTLDLNDWNMTGVKVQKVYDWAGNEVAFEQDDDILAFTYEKEETKILKLVTADSYGFAAVNVPANVPYLGATATIYNEGKVVIPEEGKISLDMSKVVDVTIGNVTKAWVNTTEVTPTFANGTLTVPCTASNDVKVYVYDGQAWYEISVFVARTVSTAEEWKELENFGAAANEYVVLTADIDLGGYNRMNSATHNWRKNTMTLDGQGHKVYNFSTMSLFDFRLENLTIKNLHLNYTATNWVTQYNGIFICGGITNVTLENVFVDVTVTKAEYARGLFANRVNNLTAKNVVFNVSVTGSGAGDIYADYLNESVMVNDVGVMGASSLENVYVISVETLKKSGEYGWDKLVVGSKASEITAIGGFFEVKSDGLYYNEKKVIEELPYLGATATVYNEGKVVIPEAGKISLDMSKVTGVTIGNVTKAWVGATEVTPTFANGILTVPCSAHSNVKVYVYDGTAWYDISVFVARTISTAEEWIALENSGALPNEYIALTADIDLGGYDRKNAATHNWRKNVMTLDGQGHKVYNFSTMTLFDYRLENLTIKNLYLEYTATNWVTQYNGVFICGGITNVTLENVFVNVTVTKADYARGLFANRVNNLTAKNVVFNVNVIGTGTGDIYADYLNESVMDNSVGVMGNSALENVYVICSETLQKSGGYGWDKLVVGSKASDVTSIGGSFEVKADGLYYNGKLVKAN